MATESDMMNEAKPADVLEEFAKDSRPSNANVDLEVQAEEGRQTNGEPNPLADPESKGIGEISAAQGLQSSIPEASTPRRRKGGGSRTSLGKKRSRLNAIKHGLSAKTVLLEGESSEEFNALLEGFRRDFPPLGMVEEVLVYNLAALQWRRRRVWRAEQAEIQLGKMYHSLTAKREKQDREEALLIETSMDAQFAEAAHNRRQLPIPGLMAHWENPVIRANILELFATLYQAVSIRIFYPDRDLEIINRIFGLFVPCECRIIYNLCITSGRMIKDDKAECLLKEFDLPLLERRDKFLDYLKELTKHYKSLAEPFDDYSAAQESLESEAAVVLEPGRLDRILRYSASLERDFDRTLTQLDRLQRMRKGQPVPPTLNVNLST